jgi:hypothetical protein
MQFADLLNQIRHESIRHIIQPQIDGAKDILISERQLEDFFNQISDALTVNDPSKIIPSLNDSFSSRGEIRQSRGSGIFTVFEVSFLFSGQIY